MHNLSEAFSGGMDDLKLINSAALRLQAGNMPEYRDLVPGLASLIDRYKALRAATRALSGYEYLCLALCGLEVMRMAEAFIVEGRDPKQARRDAREEMLKLYGYENLNDEGRLISLINGNN